MKIGILGFQGAIIEHQQRIQAAGEEPVIVRYAGQLDALDGIILPGGESTTMGKLLDRTGMKEPLQWKIQQGFPVWGTCAGMILLAKELEQDSMVHLGMMDITVKRNAYGTQIDSFETRMIIPEVSKEEIPLVFIRAPYVVRAGKQVRVLCEVGKHIVAVREKNMLATSFHPELTDNLAFHRYFIGMCRK